MKIFVLPFAGGSRYSFSSFVKPATDRGLDIVLLELPGRGARIKEPFVTDIHLLADDILRQIRGHIYQPYAIFGHSMGALLGYLVTRKLMMESMPLPAHLFFSGCGAPSVREEDKGWHLLNKESFIDKLRELGGCPEEILVDKELFAIFEPVIRSDFQAIDNYHYVLPDTLLNIPIIVMIGKDEKTTYDEAAAWQLETSEPVRVLTFPGNHFFVFGKEEELIKLVQNTITTSFYF